MRCVRMRGGSEVGWWFGVRGLVVGVVVVVVLAACGSGDGGSGGGPSSSVGGPSVSVAAGVVKDSVLDLNSTKDMTGVVTTVPIGKSPYDKNMPDICGFITQEAMDKLGVATKKKAFSGSPLIFQSCQLMPALDSDLVISAGIYVNNIQEHLSVPTLTRSGSNLVPIFASVSAHILTNDAFKALPDARRCEASWGTFYGTATVGVSDFKLNGNACWRAIEAAKILGPLMPRSPSVMRPTS